MTDDDLPAIAELVPHAGAMSLLDRVVAVEGERLLAEVVVPAEGLFTDSQGPGEGVGAWVGLEYMAQAVAAWAGWQGRQAGQAPRIGFLLGTRRYRCSVARFMPGQRLQVEVARRYQADNGLGQFEGRVSADGVELASAQLTVFGPDDPTSFLQGDTP
jgi:predicted hotdog family 3-hydroxylacyl-ACP dehydratase